MFSYLKDPAEIYRQSFAAIGEACDFSSFAAADRPLAARLVHACGMPEILDGLVLSGDPVAAGSAALSSGAPVLTDAEMVAHGVTRKHLPARNEVLCFLDRPEVSLLAAAQRTTRSAAAAGLWAERLAGAVVAIGNAPTALFRLLEMLADGAPKPAVILGFPVGFIGAAESKDALIAHAGGVPFATLTGQRGGSAMAAAAVNALALEARGAHANG